MEKWLKAGEIVAEALGKAIEIACEDIPLIKLAESIEDFIESRGGLPAFPVNVSINEVAAHYSPLVNDDSVIPPGSVVKIDVGAHVDGCIADGAITVCFSPSHAPLVETAKLALNEVVRSLKPGAKLDAIGGIVETIATEKGYKPIKNLSGHLMSRYSLHAGKNVPNVRSRTGTRARPWEVYAVEPFITDGRGYVVETEEGGIYRVVSVKRVGVHALDSLLRELWRRYRGLPFSERWIYKDIGESGLEALRKLVALKRVYVYPVLVEAGGGYVAQFEDTLLLTEKEAVNTTNVLELLKR